MISIICRLIIIIIIIIIIITITNVTNSFMYESEIMMCKAMSGLIQGERKLDYDEIEK